MNPLFTIGHSNLTDEGFGSLLKRHEVEAIADVRSSPYSQFHPQFNRETLRASLEKIAVDYVFLGRELGARRQERDCYNGNRVDYELVAALPLFQTGIVRILKGASKLRLALLCAEREPLECHRCILVARNLQSHGLDILHILGSGEAEPHNKTEERLLKLHGLENEELFRSRRSLLDEAYARQAARIAYEETKTPDNTLP